jgi:polyisoprenoid-binding protein YceI
MLHKWFGSVAMAALIVGACSQKTDSELLTPEKPAAEAPKGWASSAPLSDTAPAPSINEIPAGDYALDPAHSTLMFKVSHLGFSNFTLWFEKVSANLKLDPANPSAATLEATIDPASIMVPAPDEEFLGHLRGENLADAAKHPTITYKSTAITMTGPNTADVTGDLAFRGITKPVVLKMTYNGGYKGHAYEPRARIGFSAHGTFKRSDFGMDYGVPGPGASMGTGDDVTVVIESEWLGPPMANPPALPPPT